MRSYKPRSCVWGQQFTNGGDGNHRGVACENGMVWRVSGNVDEQLLLQFQLFRNSFDDNVRLSCGSLKGCRESDIGKHRRWRDAHLL
ncbi:hypothetical protein D3C76_1240990 [compost metagenome]